MSGPSTDGDLPSLPVQLPPEASLDEIVQTLRELVLEAFQGERTDHTLQPTAIISEAWLRLLRRPDLTFSNVCSFRVWAAKVVRHILVDYARGKRTEKRRSQREIINTELLLSADQPIDPDTLLDLHEALEAMSRVQPRMARVVELKFFGGLSDEMIAQVLSLRTPQVRVEWKLARAWLRQRMSA